MHVWCLKNIKRTLHLLHIISIVIRSILSICFFFFCAKSWRYSMEAMYRQCIKYVIVWNSLLFYHSNTSISRFKFICKVAFMIFSIFFVLSVFSIDEHVWNYFVSTVTHQIVINTWTLKMFFNSLKIPKIIVNDVNRHDFESNKNSKSIKGFWIRQFIKREQRQKKQHTRHGLINAL